MEIVPSVAIQAVLLGAALFVTLTRCWVRFYVDGHTLTASDYLAWCGWVCTAGWVTCSMVALHVEKSHPLADDSTTDSVKYLKTVFISCYFFDVGLYFPKASILSFYWWLVPRSFARLRLGLYAGMGYTACAFIASVLTDTLICWPISDNWSIENQLGSIWNSYTDFTVNWGLNFSIDLLLFCFPFFLLNSLNLLRRQKIGLIGIFSLGLITLAISLARFIVYSVTDYNVDDASGNAWCTAEMCTAVIVVSLPTLKSLLVCPTPRNTSKRSTFGYMQSGTAQNPSGKGTVISHIEAGVMDDEIELVYLGGNLDLLSPDPENGVFITKDVTIRTSVGGT